LRVLYYINIEREETTMKLHELTKQYEDLRTEAEMLESWIMYADSIELNALADELEDRLDKVESLMYVVNTQIKKLEVNK
jgi:hypothetical protein